MKRHELATSSAPENKRKPSAPMDAREVIETGGKVVRGAEGKLEKIRKNNLKVQPKNLPRLSAMRLILLIGGMTY